MLPSELPHQYATLPAVAAADQPQLLALSQRLSYSFQDLRWLRWALTTRAWCGEHPGAGWPNYTALEWIGDSVLNLMVSRRILNEWDRWDKGTGTEHRQVLVNNIKLSQIADNLNLWSAMFLGVGQRRNTPLSGQMTLLANAFEAVLGAIWYDANLAGRDGLAAVEIVFEAQLDPGDWGPW
jgi:ribonuclease-3